MVVELLLLLSSKCAKNENGVVTGGSGMGMGVAAVESLLLGVGANEAGDSEAGVLPWAKADVDVKGVDAEGATNDGPGEPAVGVDRLAPRCITERWFLSMSVDSLVIFCCCCCCCKINRCCCSRSFSCFTSSNAFKKLSSTVMITGTIPASTTLVLICSEPRTPTLTTH